METSPNAHVKLTAWRLARENFANDPRLAKIDKTMGSPVQGLYEQARAATDVAARRKVLDGFAAATDNWTKSAYIAAAGEQAATYVVEALGYERPQALADFVTNVAPAALPASAERLLVAAAGVAPGTTPLKASIVRAVARMEGGNLVLNAASTKALQTLLSDPATSAAALPIAARWDTAGTLRPLADARARDLVAELVRRDDCR